VTAPAWKPDPAKVRLLAIDLLEFGVSGAAWPRLYDLLACLGGSDDLLGEVRYDGHGFYLTTARGARLRQEGEVRS
jgi:hypothetical protein